MQPKIESKHLAEIIKFGQTGVLNKERLAAIGALMDCLKTQVRMIGESRNCGHYESVMDEGIGISEDGFEYCVEEEDRCDNRTDRWFEYVTFEDFLEKCSDA